MTRLSAVCLLVVLLALAAAAPAQAYTVMKTRPYTWYSLADNDHLSVAPAEFMNPLSGYVQPGIPQNSGQPGPGGNCGPGMNCGGATGFQPYRQAPGYLWPAWSPWH